MNIVRRSREELESYIAGYIAAVRDMHVEQNFTANCRNQVRALLNRMDERRDFLQETFGYKEQIDNSDIESEDDET